MLFFILKRLAQSLLVMAVVSAVSFSLFNFVGDPVNNMVGQDATREQRVEIREQLGLNDPVLTQYTRFISNAVRGEFGLSYRIRRPVDTLIMERLPATLELCISHHRVGRWDRIGRLYGHPTKQLAFTRYSFVFTGRG